MRTDKKLLFARPPVLVGAAWVRENWFLGSPGTPNTGRAGPGCQHGGFARFRPVWAGAAGSSLSAEPKMRQASPTPGSLSRELGGKGRHRAGCSPPEGGPRLAWLSRSARSRSRGGSTSSHGSYVYGPRTPSRGGLDNVPDAQIKSRHRLEGSLAGGGGETPGRRKTSCGGRPRWRTPRILLEYSRNRGPSAPAPLRPGCAG